MAARSHWKGYLKLSLVSCPVALYPAISAADRISFRQVNRRTGNRIRQQLVDAVTGQVVQADDKGRGYEVAQDDFVLVQDEEIEAARHEARTTPYIRSPAAAALPRSDLPIRNSGAPPREERRRSAPEAEPHDVDAAGPAAAPVRVENNRTIVIERFFPRSQIDARYVDTPYYIAPREEIAQEAFAVIREAMRSKEVVGLGRVVLSKRERPILIQPMGNGLCGTTLRFAHEVRSEAEVFAGIPDLTLPHDVVQVAERILETKLSDFDAALLEDRYRTVLLAKLKEKRAGLPKRADAAAPSRQNVIDLLDVLKRSLETERVSAVRKPPVRRGADKASPRPARGAKTRTEGGSAG